MNILDISVIILLAICILTGVARGFIRTVLGFANFIIAIILTNILYPHFSRFLRSIDGFYYSMREAVSSALRLDELVAQQVGTAANDVIQSLPLPQAFRDYISANNNPVVHTAVAATGLAEFIAGFIASIIINILSMIIVFMLVYIGLIILMRVLDLVAKLPVVNTLNKLLGGVVGAVWGLILVWFLLGAAVLYFSVNTGFPMAETLNESVIAGFLHELNPALGMILRFIP